MTPAEDFLQGVSFRGVELRFGPSGLDIIAALLVLILGGATAVLFIVSRSGGTLNGYEVKNAFPMVLAGVVGLAWCVVWSTATFRSGVIASPRSLLLRTRWRSRRIDWQEVVAVRVHEDEQVPVGFRVGVTGIGLYATPGTLSRVEVVLGDGHVISLPGTEAMIAGDGLVPKGELTGAEMKARMLIRYREQVVGAWPADAPSPNRRLSLVSKWAGFVGFATVVAAMWALTCWATDRFIPPVFPIVGLVVAAVRQARTNRQRRS